MDNFETFYQNLNVSSIDTLLAKIDLQIFNYEGFNARVIAETFYKRCGEDSRDEKINKLMKCIAFAISNGSITEKSYRKLGPDAKAEYSILEQQFILKRGAVTDKANDLTVQRIMAAFPDLGVRTSLRMAEKNFVGPCKSVLLPRVFKNNSMPALLHNKMSENKKMLFKFCCLAYSIDQTLTISKESDRDTQEKKRMLAANQLRFIEIAMGSTWPTQVEKCNSLTKIERMENLNGKDYEVMNEVAKLSASFIGYTFLGYNYTEDSY